MGNKVKVLFSVLLGIHLNADGSPTIWSKQEDTVDAVVTIPTLGTLQGISTTSYFTTRSIYQFLGINYALPPSKERRFQPPEKFAPWSDSVYNATKMRQRCPQADLAYYPPLNPDLIDRKEDEEDCLVVNVFTPKLPKNKEDPLLPVFFYIHGGSFYYGSAYDFLPDFLLEKDILLVVPQYRLGPLGFASLQTDSIPGNAAMLDIVLALEWVQENIQWFGGDQKKVTVVGQSAGAAAASALLVSPLVPQGVFSQMVIQSGSASPFWATTEDPTPSTKAIGKLAGCSDSDAELIANCLKRVPVQDLVKAQIDYANAAANDAGCYLVVQQAGGDKKFLTELPHLSFERGNFKKVPIMGGTTRDEGSTFVKDLYPLLSLAPAEYFERNITRDVLQLVGITDRSNGAIDFFHNKYFLDTTNIRDALPALIDLMGAFLMKAPTNNIIRRMSSFQPSYLYSFNFYGNASKLAASKPLWDATYPFPSGVAHADELGYLFPMANHSYTERELKMVKIMVDLWTNFVINGKPAPTPDVTSWPSMQEEFGSYLRIDERHKLFQNIFSEYEMNSREGYVYVNEGGRPQTETLLLLPVLCILHIFNSQ